MSVGYIGEIRIFGGNFAPVGWLFCDGSLVPITEYETLFQLIGTTYGGDGETNFALPDLRGRAPVHQGSGAIIGEAGGVEEVTLTLPQLPAHGHTPLASVAAATSGEPGAATWAAGATAAFATTAPDTDLAIGAVGPSGGSLPHENRSPSLGVNFIIATVGVFPSPD